MNKSLNKSASLRTHNTGHSKKLFDSQKNTSIYKTSKLESNRSLVVHRCGCVKSVAVELSALPSVETQKVLIKPQMSLLRLQSLQPAKKCSSVPKVAKNKSPSSTGIIKKLESLKTQYESLEKEVKIKRVDVIRCVPSQVIRRVDKVKKVERPLEKVIKRVTRIPQQIIRYQTVEKEVPLHRQRLVFVDPQPLQPATDRIGIDQQRVSILSVPSPTNQRMRADLLHLVSTTNQLQNLVVDSSQTISNIRSSIYTSRSKREMSYPNTLSTYELVSQEEIPPFSPSSVLPRSENVIPKEEGVQCSFFNSVVSMSLLTFGEESWPRNPEEHNPTPVKITDATAPSNHHPTHHISQPPPLPFDIHPSSSLPKQS